MGWRLRARDGMERARYGMESESKRWDGEREREQEMGWRLRVRDVVE